MEEGGEAEEGFFFGGIFLTSWRWIDNEGLRCGCILKNLFYNGK